MTSAPPPRASPPAPALAALPPHLVNGLSVALGLVAVCGAIGSTAGMHAALAASAGAASVSIADTPVAPRAKPAQMLPAWLGASLAAALALASHGAPLALGLVVVGIAALSVAWMAYGLRGGPQGFVPVLMLVFQMSALRDGPLQDALALFGWAVLGGGLYALWAVASAQVLATRYRRLALAHCLATVAGVSRAQAAHAADCAAGLADRAGIDTLLPLVRLQAAMAEPLQRARDLLYDLPDEHRDAPLVAALLHLIELRDQLLACQLDLEPLVAEPQGRVVLPQLAQALDTLAARLDEQADALRRSQPVPGAAPLDAALDALRPASGDAAALALLRQSLAARLGRVAAEHAQLSATLQPGAPVVPALPAELRESFLSPRGWPLAALRALWQPGSPLRRYLLRAMAAFGTAYVVGLALPWVSHEQWLLLTVAVVLRGSLEQTLARRDARVLGTLVGCVIAGLLFAFAPSQAVLLAVTAVAVAIAHAYVLVDYRLTATASAVMGLAQSHLWIGAQRFAVPERLADTLVGAALAWAFCYLLPSWERQQLPALSERLLKAEAEYARHALVPAALRGAERGWRLARREVYDVLWMLAQTLQRASREPLAVRPALPAIEALLLHGHRLTSQLAALRGLLAQQHPRLDSQRAGPALRRAEDRFETTLLGAPSEADEAAPAADDAAIGERAPALDGDPTPFLLRRLAQADREAVALARAAGALRASL